MLRPLTAALALGAVVVAAAQAPAPATADAAFADFFQARTQAEAAAASTRIGASGVAFDDAWKRLKTDSGEYFYAVDVPAEYDPARKYQVRIQLHGGVDRIEDNRPRDSGTGGRLSGAEQIYVMPYAWRGAPWWSARQVENVRTILDLVKRDYNVDENRVALSGVSDGGTGAYYIAMRDTTPFASVLPLNGFLMVLRNETPEAESDLFPQNLLNKPMFIVNGGRDPLYPASVVQPYVEHLKAGGVTLEYRPQPNAGHDTSWWPVLKDEFEHFVAEHPRQPLPDTLTWEAADAPARAHWLVIDRLAPGRADAAALPDVNAMSTPPIPDFGIRASGPRINRVVKGSNAEQVGLRSGDVVVGINNQPAAAGTEVAELLTSYPAGRPLLLTVTRAGESIRLTGKYAPTVLPGEADAMFPRQRPSGRVDLARTGNRVDAATRGVGAFTLLLSPDQFDLSRAITVSVNGRTVFDGPVQKNLGTLLKWAARDQDRTMLFGAELAVEVP
jgi:acetyl esterase/lipase